jgi:hypothetical protein
MHIIKVIFTLLTAVQNILLFDNDAALPVLSYCWHWHMYLNSTQRMHCCISMAIMVTWMCHCVTLHVHCLSCYSTYFTVNQMERASQCKTHCAGVHILGWEVMYCYIQGTTDSASATCRKKMGKAAKVSHIPNFCSWHMLVASFLLWTTPWNSFLMRS